VEALREVFRSTTIADIARRESDEAGAGMYHHLMLGHVRSNGRLIVRQRVRRLYSATRVSRDLHAGAKQCVLSLVKPRLRVNHGFRLGVGDRQGCVADHGRDLLAYLDRLPILVCEGVVIAEA